MKARYTILIYQSNQPLNLVTVKVIAQGADEAVRKAKALAPNIHSPIVKVETIVEEAP